MAGWSRTAGISSRSPPSPKTSSTYEYSLTPDCLTLSAPLPLADSPSLVLGSPDREGESWTRTLMRFENGQVATLEMGGYPGAFYVRRTRPNSSLSSFASLLCSLGAVSVSVALNSTIRSL